MATEAPLDSSDPGASKALKAKVRDRLNDTARHVDALNAAMAEFGDEFDPVVFRSAFQSRDPRLLNKVKAVERGSEQLYNYIAELARFGLELSTVIDQSAEPNARRDFRKLREIGVISGSQESRLQTLRELRRNLVHEYPGVIAGDVRDAAILVSQEFRPFVDRYTDWIRADFSPGPG